MFWVTFLNRKEPRRHGDVIAEFIVMFRVYVEEFSARNMMPSTWCVYLFYFRFPVYSHLKSRPRSRPSISARVIGACDLFFLDFRPQVVINTNRFMILQCFRFACPQNGILSVNSFRSKICILFYLISKVSVHAIYLFAGLFTSYGHNLPSVCQWV